MYKERNNLFDDISRIDKEVLSLQNNSNFKDKISQRNNLIKSINDLSLKAVDGKLPNNEYNTYQQLINQLNILDNDSIFKSTLEKINQLTESRNK